MYLHLQTCCLCSLCRLACAQTHTCTQADRQSHHFEDLFKNFFFTLFPSSLCVKLLPPGVHIQVQPHECMPACAVNELTETGWCSSIVCLFFVLLGHTQSVNVVVLCSVCTAQTEVPKKLQIKPYK